MVREVHNASNPAYASVEPAHFNPPRIDEVQALWRDLEGVKVDGAGSECERVLASVEEFVERLNPHFDHR